MQKLEEEFIQNGGEWVEVDFSDVFNISRGDIQNQRTLIEDVDGISFIAQNDNNNGFVCKVSNTNHKEFDGNCIIVGRQTGVVYYQPDSFITTDGVLVLLDKIGLIINRKVGLFIVSILKKQMWVYGYTNTVSATKLNNLTFTLPFLNGEIYFSYMEKYIEELEALRIEELEAYLRVTGLRDYKLTEEDKKVLDEYYQMKDNFLYKQIDRQTERQIRLFSVGQIFDISTPKRKFNANAIKFGGKYPYITRGETDNGVRGYISEDKEFLNDGNTISFGQDTATMFYQKDPYFTGDKIKVFTPKEIELDKHSAMYLITSVKKTLDTFTWGSTSYNVNNLKEIILELPSINGKVDYEYLAKLIKVIEKLVVKDVVIWMDNRIEATKQVVAQDD